MEIDFSLFLSSDQSTISTKLLQTLLDNIPTGVEVLKAVREKDHITDFEYVLANQVAQNRAGNTKLVGKKLLSRPDSDKHLFSRMVEVVETGREFQILVNNSAYGSPRRSIYKYVKFGDGVILYIDDISEKKLSEQTALDSQEFIENIANSTPDIIYVLDLETRTFVYMNNQGYKILGLTEKEIKEKGHDIFFQVIHADDYVRRMNHYTQTGSDPSGNIHEIEVRKKVQDGTYHWFRIRDKVFKRNKDGVAINIIGISTDIQEQKQSAIDLAANRKEAEPHLQKEYRPRQNITTRKEKEEQRRTSLNILHQTEQVVIMGSWEYDIINDKFIWSEGMYRLFSLSNDVEVRPEIYRAYTPDSEKPVVDRLINHILFDFIPFEETVTLLTSEYEKKIIKIKGVVQKDKKGRPLKMVGVDLDITQQVNDSEEIKKLYDTLVKKNNELQELNNEIKTFNIVSAQHYKETLQQLYTNLEYIVSKDARHLSDTSKANIRRAQSAIQKMNLLTDDINAYFNLFDIEAEIKYIDPNLVIKNVINTYKPKLEQNNASIRHPELPMLPSHPVLFSQLVGNLIDNAIKFRNLSSPLVIEIKYSQSDELNAVAAAQKDTPYGIMSVSDNGVGFTEEEEVEKIFEIFYRLSDSGKNKGRGIGLAICKKIMVLHDGFITAEGAPARGATFNCWFPLRST